MIGDDCCVDDCVIGNDVTLGKNVKVNKKAVLGPGKSSSDVLFKETISILLVY